ncbi:MAG: hypothetical protein ACTSO9_07865 [Candidatus Helarchaeota archaeon]
MKEFAELKELITEKIEEIKEKINNLQKELERYTSVLMKIDSVLEKESFKTAAELYQAETKPIEKEMPPKKIKEPEINKEFEIKSDDETVLGNMIVEKNLITIIPTNKINIPENSAPFRNFFLGRILKQMENEDVDAIKNKKLDKNQAISWEIIKSSEDKIQKLIIRNYRTYNRMIKILDTISWTFRTLQKPK